MRRDLPLKGVVHPLPAKRNGMTNDSPQRTRGTQSCAEEWARTLRVLGDTLCVLRGSRRQLRFRAALVVLPLFLSAVHAADAPSSIAAGVARVDITPSYPVRLSGYGGRRVESSGVTQRIWEKALVIGGDGAIGDDSAAGGADAGPAVLVTVDNLGVPAALVEKVAARLKA